MHLMLRRSTQYGFISQLIVKGREYLSFYDCCIKVVHSKIPKLVALCFPKTSAKICQLSMQIIAQYFRQTCLITFIKLLFKFDLINTIPSMA